MTCPRVVKRANPVACPCCLCEKYRREVIMQSYRLIAILAVVLFGAPAAAQLSPADIFLDAHNAERQNYPVSPLQWSPELAGYAQQWANELARRNDPSASLH